MSLNDWLAPKQLKVLHSYLHDDFDMMILVGAIRSGKTFIDNLLFIYELRRTARLAKANRDKHPQYILAGATSDSIHKNVIVSCENQFGVEFKLDRHGHYKLWGVDIVPVSTKTIAGLANARGFDSYGGYVNEATMGVEPVFQEILQRCSKDGARVIVDSNPDQPQHWFKTDYIDNNDPKTKKITFHFTIDDNTHLSKRYIEGIKARTPSGMFYERAILGLWVSGDGAVYRDFDERKMVVPKAKLPHIVKYYCGVDWGFEHKGVITVWGDDAKGNIYLIEEHTSQFKYISYWVKVAKKIQEKYGKGITFWVDSARPDNYSEFLRAGINACNADKARMAGVERVAEYMKQGKLFAVQDNMDQFLNEVYQYVWDENTGEPKKENDDVMDSMRYAIFNEHKDNQTQFLNSKYF